VQPNGDADIWLGDVTTFNS